MGTGSLVAPFVIPPLLRPFSLRRGRSGRAVVGLVVGAAAVTTVADRVVRRSADAGPGEPGAAPPAEGDDGRGRRARHPHGRRAGGRSRTGRAGWPRWEGWPP